MEGSGGFSTGAVRPARTAPLVGNSEIFDRLRGRITSVASAQRTTLICGPTGSGKELVARALHDQSDRRRRPYVTVHCATLPDTLVEAEMFGHSRGAFTGATQARLGLIGSAATGTLFLDEVDSLPAAAQAKLLRFLETGEYRAVGSDRVEQSAAWVIASTNQELGTCVQRGAFRADLMYRLSVVRLDVPALAQRREDILVLADHFLALATGGSKRLADQARGALTSYDWPGNVRELKHRVESAALFHGGDEIDASALGLADDDALDAPGSATPVPSTMPLERELWSLIEDQGLTLSAALARCEEILVQQALRAEGMNRTRAAGRLGIHVRTIFKKLTG
ncbi:MAG TPA: sigma-54 dependent transcriptional regulator [Kofleriaceae bacterium]|nr:sigma-54 dependent transcriptional regulator [Kofleriaceae bacterium]